MKNRNRKFYFRIPKTVSNKLKRVSPSYIEYLYWERYYSLPQIAKILKVTPQALSLFMTKHNIPRRSRGRVKFEQIVFYPDINTEYLKELYYNKNLSQTEIANMFNISKPRLAQMLKAKGIKRMTLSTTIDPEQMRSLYWDVGYNVEELARHYGCRQPTITRLMKAHNILTRRQCFPKGSSVNLYNRMCRDYEGQNEALNWIEANKDILEEEYYFDSLTTEIAGLKEYGFYAYGIDNKNFQNKEDR